MIQGATVSPLYSSTLWLEYCKAEKCEEHTIGQFLKCDVLAAIRVGLIVNQSNLQIDAASNPNCQPSESTVKTILKEAYQKVGPPIFIAMILGL